MNVIQHLSIKEVIKNDTVNFKRLQRKYTKYDIDVVLYMHYRKNNI